MKVAFTSVAITIACALPGFMIGSMFVFVQEDVLMRSWVLGVLVCVFWVTAAAASSLATLLVNVLGPMGTLHASAALAACSLVATSAVSGHWLWLLFGVVSAGVATSISHPASNVLITALIPQRDQGLLFGLKQAAVPVSSGIVGISIPLVVVSHGWRVAYLAAALLILLISATVLLTVHGFGTGAPAPQRASPEPSPRKLGFFVLLSMMTFFGTGAANVIASFAILFSPESKVSAALAGSMLALASMVGAVVRVFAGLVQRNASTAMRTIIVLLGLGAAGSVLLAYPRPIAYIVGLCLALGCGWGWAGLTHYIVAVTAGTDVAKATSITQVGTYLGCALFPLLIGVLSPVLSASVIWLSVALLFLIASLLAGLLLAMSRREN